jgi:hypothetical protein
MTQPTIPDYFGIGAQIITAEQTIAATAAAPYLVIPFSGLADSGLSDVASMNDPDKIFAAFIKLARVFTFADVAEESGIEVGAPRKSFVTRANTTKIGYDYSVTLYLPDPTAAEADPDLVV